MHKLAGVAGNHPQRSAAGGVLNDRLGRADEKLEAAVKQGRHLRGVAENRRIDLDSVLGEIAVIEPDPERHVEVGARDQPDGKLVSHGNTLRHRRMTEGALRFNDQESVQP
jgi:hypothetical protein